MGVEGFKNILRRFLRMGITKDLKNELEKIQGVEANATKKS